MDYCKINGKSYDVIIQDIEESYEVLYSDNTGRTIAIGAPLTLDPLGTFITYKVTFARISGKEKEYDDLFTFLMQPRREGFRVDLVHNQTTINYLAYSSNGSRKIVKILPKSNTVHWDSMSVSFIPMEAQVLPI